ncbi:MAG: hypothetical protein ACREBK_05315 [Sphingomicrobium sp.]
MIASVSIDPTGNARLATPDGAPMRPKVVLAIPPIMLPNKDFLVLAAGVSVHFAGACWANADASLKATSGAAASSPDKTKARDIANSPGNISQIYACF